MAAYAAALVDYIESDDGEDHTKPYGNVTTPHCRMLREMSHAAGYITAHGARMS